MTPHRTAPHPPTSRARSRRWLPILAAALVLTGAACSSSDGDAADDGSTTTTAAGGSGGETTTTAGSGTDDGSGTEASGYPDVDLCEAITAEDAEAVLEGATIVAAEPMPGDAPSCQYFIDASGGMQLAVAQIQLQPMDFYAGQQELQTDEEPVPGLDDAFTIGDSSILVKGDDRVVLVNRGVELTTGGASATNEQLAALAQQALDA